MVYNDFQHKHVGTGGAAVVTLPVPLAVPPRATNKCSLSSTAKDDVLKKVFREQMHESK